LKRRIITDKVWDVTPETAAKILAGHEWQDFWKSVNADEFLNLRLAMPGKENIEAGKRKHERSAREHEDAKRD
jgi:hypothetical protein